MMGLVGLVRSVLGCACFKHNNQYTVNKVTKAEDDAKIDGDVPAPDETIDIDLNDPEVNAAATKIQASFKGHKARKEVQAIKEGRAVSPAEAAGETEPAARENDIDLNDPDANIAAVKIQANFRGYKVRKGAQNDIAKKQSEEVPTGTDEANIEAEVDVPEEHPEVEKPDEHPEIDIDMEDPNTAKAATKIQASFRGHQARKNLKKDTADDNA